MITAYFASCDTTSTFRRHYGTCIYSSLNPLFHPAQSVSEIVLLLYEELNSSGWRSCFIPHVPWGGARAKTARTCRSLAELAAAARAHPRPIQFMWPFLENRLVSTTLAARSACLRAARVPRGDERPPPLGRRDQQQATHAKRSGKQEHRRRGQVAGEGPVSRTCRRRRLSRPEEGLAAGTVDTEAAAALLNRYSMMRRSAAPSASSACEMREREREREGGEERENPEGGEGALCAREDCSGPVRGSCVYMNSCVCTLVGTALVTAPDLQLCIFSRSTAGEVHHPEIIARRQSESMILKYTHTRINMFSFPSCKLLLINICYIS